jgi:RNA polymerase sigma factor (sigma-70 family)
VQAVFLVLAQKAQQLVDSERESLSAWLFHVMHFACARLRRAQTRQQHHVEAAASVRAAQVEPALPIDDALLELLEDSIAQLSPNDREAIVRRIYQRQDFAGIGAAMNISAEAARKQVTRALARLRAAMVRDGVDFSPDALLEAVEHDRSEGSNVTKTVDRGRVGAIAKGTIDMIDEAQDLGFAVVSAEFYVQDVEANLDFFEKLGFLRRWTETPDAMGRIPRASLRGGTGRIWLRRASAADGTRPTPGVVLYFWIAGGPDALLAHRTRLASRGLAVSPFNDDHVLRNFTVTTPDGYAIGFFTQYRE